MSEILEEILAVLTRIEQKVDRLTSAQNRSGKTKVGSEDGMFLVDSVLRKLREKTKMTGEGGRVGVTTKELLGEFGKSSTEDYEALRTSLLQLEETGLVRRDRPGWPKPDRWFVEKGEENEKEGSSSSSIVDELREYLRLKGPTVWEEIQKTFQQFCPEVDRMELRSVLEEVGVQDSRKRWLLREGDG